MLLKISSIHPNRLIDWCFLVYNCTFTLINTHGFFFKYSRTLGELKLQVGRHPGVGKLLKLRFFGFGSREIGQWYETSR